MNEKPIVVMLDSAEAPDSEDCVLEAEVLEGHCNFRQAFVTTDAEIVAACEEAVAIIMWHHVSLGEAILKQLSRCRLIVRNGVGFDNVDVVAAARCGIPVCNVPDYGSEEVADHALALALSVTRRIFPSFSDVRSGNWNWRSAKPIHRARTMTFGILGCGRIGTAVALRAKAFGYSVTFFDPYLPDGIEKALGIRRSTTLEDLLRDSDVLSLHTPLTKETRHIICANTIPLMKSGAMIVNTSRGPVVEEAALAEALESGHLGGAGLDVIETELRPNTRLFNLPNCVVTPHSAFYSEESQREMRQSSAKAVLHLLLGQKLRNVVNGHLLEFQQSEHVAL